MVRRRVSRTLHTTRSRPRFDPDDDIDLSDFLDFKAALTGP